MSIRDIIERRVNLKYSMLTKGLTIKVYDLIEEHCDAFS